MSAGPGILLIHGYTGSPEDLEPLAQVLAEAHGPEAVTALRLPGHGDGAVPGFDREAFLAAIGEAAAALAGRDLILVGHSTGGILALDAVARFGLNPALLVLASVPNRIDAAYQARWAEHGGGRPQASFAAMAGLILLINATGARPLPGTCPVLILHGEEDRLVPVAETSRWRDRLAGPGRTVLVPGGGHHPFQGPGQAFALDGVARAVADAAHRPGTEERALIARLVEEEPTVARFLAAAPGSGRHLALAPSGRRIGKTEPPLAPEGPGEPVFANIEITTRCNQACVFCARTAASPGPPRTMSLATFRRVLDLLPHAYRITLVGLGEPLMHPEVAEFVAEASAGGRRVSLATNAMLLTEDLARRLLAAGLAGIVFSLDATTPELAAQVRAGTVLETALENMRTFCRLAAEGPAKVGCAVFSAVSLDTAPHLGRLVATVAGLGVDVLMLSDLNFPENLPHALWQHVDPPLREMLRQAVRQAFALGLPVLSVRGLEAFALPVHYQEHLLVPPASLYQRSSTHSHCHSPWQTLPVAVDGTVTLCDCQSRQKVGNLLTEPFSHLWRHGPLAEHRARMLGPEPPEACAICPRF